MLPPVQKLGSDATAAGDRHREQSEWPRSAAEEAALAATKMPGVRISPLGPSKDNPNAIFQVGDVFGFSFYI